MLFNQKKPTFTETQLKAIKPVLEESFQYNAAITLHVVNDTLKTSPAVPELLSKMETNAKELMNLLGSKQPTPGMFGFISSVAMGGIGGGEYAYGHRATPKEKKKYAQLVDIANEYYLAQSKA